MSKEGLDGNANSPKSRQTFAKANLVIHHFVISDSELLPSKSG